MAVCLTLMAGRTGVVGGSLMIGALIETHCSLAFVVLSGVSLHSTNLCDDNDNDNDDDDDDDKLMSRKMNGKRRCV
ncbi:unnamed protein product [Timema podura]|uniref:Secreted protein n=1 Tax=Timema podura TaxID=61482 RepID=A0ABN7NSB8_TIMPD|nr:unnamed protein product [Timema podura]